MKRAFIRIQCGLVWQWYGQRNYTHQMARRAWIHTALLILLSTFVGLVIRAILTGNWL